MYITILTKIFGGYYSFLEVTVVRMCSFTF